MGIPGLFTFLRRNGCYENYDLVALAKNNPNLEILVDFYGIEQHILERTLLKLTTKYQNEYLLIPGGEYDELVNAFRDFHLMFVNIGIKLIYIADGPKGLDKLNQQQKEKSWVYRFERNMRVYKTYLDMCKNPPSPLQKIYEKIIRPCLTSDMFKAIIIKEGGTILNLIYGEADYQIANLRKERNSWAVLTNDSDFFIFRDCPTIHIGLFDIDRDFMHGRNFRDNLDDFKSNINPKKLTVGLTSDRILMDRLRLSSHDKLIDFSILMGNDYTVDFSENLRNFCGIKWKYDFSDIPHSMKVAEWVEQQLTRLIDSNEFASFSMNKPDLKLSVKFSMDFYKQIPTEPIPKFTSKENEEFWNYLVERYQKGEISSMCLSVFHGFCYQRNCVQPIIVGINQDINSLLVPLKTRIYSLLIQKGISTVIEYEVPNTADYTRLINIPESSINLKSFLASPDKYNAFDFFDSNWSRTDFKDICQSHNLNDSRLLNYFNKFGTEIGFCCYCLRILWCVSKRTRFEELDLVITEIEFRAVFCTVFFRLIKRIYPYSRKYQILQSEIVEKYPNDWFYKLKLCPSSVCETTQEWLQIIYFVAYTLYGKSLNIAQYFPEAYEFISGTVLTAFFEYVHNDGQRIRNAESKNINSIYEMMSAIYEEFHPIYEAILEPF